MEGLLTRGLTNALKYWLNLIATRQIDTYDTATLVNYINDVSYQDEIEIT